MSSVLRLQNRRGNPHVNRPRLPRCDAILMQLVAFTVDIALQ